MKRRRIDQTHLARIAAPALALLLAACQASAETTLSITETAIPPTVTASPSSTPVPPTATATPRTATRTPIIPHTPTKTRYTPPAGQSSAKAVTRTAEADADEIRSALAGLGRIAFFNTDGLATIRPDGSDLRIVRDEAEVIPSVSWSPNGRRLVYGSGFQIGVAEADGSGYWSITGPGDDNITSFHPDWSPDGEWIAYITDRSLREAPDAPIAGMRYDDLFIMRPDGTDPRNLSPELPFNSASPDWSPSGIWIAFRYGNQIYIVDSVSRGMNPITSDNNCENDNPTWSPDGEWVAFAGECGGMRQLYMVSVEDPEKIFEIRPRNPVAKWSPDQPTWSPDGRFIAFQNDRKIMVMDLPSLYVIVLTDGVAPAWSPAGVE
jgi:Tol biopolymer transport system component